MTRLIPFPFIIHISFFALLTHIVDSPYLLTQNKTSRGKQVGEEEEEEEEKSRPPTPSAPANSARIDDLLERLGYDTPELVKQFRIFHDTLGRLKTGAAKHGDKYLEQYPDSAQIDQIKLARDSFLQLCDEAGGPYQSNRPVFRFVSAPWLAAGVARLRRAILKRRDYSDVPKISSDLYELFLGQEDYLQTRLLAKKAKAKKEVASVKDELKGLQYVKGVSRLAIILASEKVGAQAKKEGESEQANELTAAENRYNAMLNAGEEAVGARHWKKETTDTKKNHRMNSMLKPKNAAQLVGHTVALDMVLTGLDSITVGDLSPKTKSVVEAFVKDKTTEANDSTTVSYICSHVIAPDLKKSVPTRGDDGAFNVFKKIIDDLKSPSSKNLSKFYNASTDVPVPIASDDSVEGTNDKGSGEDEGASDGLEGEDAKEGNDATTAVNASVKLTSQKLKDFLTLFSGVFLSDCIKIRLEELVGFKEDVLTLVLRCSLTTIQKSLFPMIFGQCCIFKDSLEHSKIALVCKYLTTMVKNASESHLKVPKDEN